MSNSFLFWAGTQEGLVRSKGQDLGLWEMLIWNTIQIKWCNKVECSGMSYNLIGQKVSSCFWTVAPAANLWNTAVYVLVLACCLIWNVYITFMKGVSSVNTFKFNSRWASWHFLISNSYTVLSKCCVIRGTSSERTSIAKSLSLCSACGRNFWMQMCNFRQRCIILVVFHFCTGAKAFSCSSRSVWGFVLSVLRCLSDQLFCTNCLFELL